MLSRSFASASLGLWLSALTPAAFGQWTTAVVDGAVSSTEYGANNSIGTNTSQTWYITWDGSNLYVGITNANLAEAAVVYISPNPPSPVTGGTNADGNLTGFNYDGTGFSNLPFRSRFVTYFKSDYREYRTADGAGGWSGPTANAGQFATGSGSVREISIPWSAITNGAGIPSSFVFFGYLTSSGGYVYGQAPNDNPGTTIGTSATFTQYYAIVNTGNGVSTPPFSNERPTGFGADVKTAFKHDSFDPFYRSPAGALPAATQVTLRFRTGHFDADGVTTRAYLFDTATGVTNGPVDTATSFDQNIVESGKTYDMWKVTLTMPSTTTIYYYKFKIFKGSTSGFYSDDYSDDNDDLHKDGTGVASDGEPFNAYQVTVYDPNFQTPLWLQNANVYQIFPDRFRNGAPANDYCTVGTTSGCPTYYGNQPAFSHTVWNEQLCDPRGTVCPGAFSNQFFGGDLLGIQNELDYLQAVGMDTFYLTPIFLARSNHRYDTDQYLTVDPALGGDTAFASLQQEADRRGIRLILDGVFNHASSDSLYFDRYHRYATDGGCESLTSVWRSWFHFSDAVVPCASADYPGWFGFDSLPTFDHDNSQVRDFFYRGNDNVTSHWYSRGAAGWRFDVAPDGNFPRSWWHEYRTFAKGYKSDGPLIGEIWPNASQWLAGDQMDSVMNYRFRKDVIGFARAADWTDDNNNGTNRISGLTPSQFDHALHAIRDDYPAQASAAMLNLLDSHDTNRALFVLTETGDTGLTEAKQRLKLAALLQFTYVGAPMVFYGDEVAINSPSLASSANGPIGDPYTRAPYPWTDQGGNPAVYGPPDTDILAFYTRLSHLRKQYPVLRNGAFAALLTGDTQASATAANTFAFARQSGAQVAIVALNNGATSNMPAIPVGSFISNGVILQDLLSGNTYNVSGGVVQVTLGPRSGVVLVPGPATVDLVPPQASAAASSVPNAAGWNNSPVNVNLGATDTGGSGIAQLRWWMNSGPTNVLADHGATLVTAEGNNMIGVRALDNAGNISALVKLPVSIDLHPPVVLVTGVSATTSYPFNLAPVSGCNTSDALSGVAVNAMVSVTGGNGKGYGSYTATCSGASDNAGNAAGPISVSYSVAAPPLLGALITGKTGPTNARVWTLRFSDDAGSGPASGVQVTSFTFMQTSGSACTPSVTSAAPAIASIVPGTNATTPVTIDFTGCDSLARFQVTAPFTANNGAVSGTMVLNQQAP